MKEQWNLYVLSFLVFGICMEPVLKPVWNLYVLSCLALSCLAPDFCLALICLDFVYLIKEEFCMHKLFWHKYCHLPSFRWLARKPRQTLQLHTQVCWSVNFSVSSLPVHKIVLNSWTFSAPNICTFFRCCNVTESFSESLHFVGLGLCTWGSGNPMKISLQGQAKAPLYNYS